MRGFFVVVAVVDVLDIVIVVIVLVIVVIVLVLTCVFAVDNFIVAVARDNFIGSNI